jgi:hypothetical protein
MLLVNCCTLSLELLNYHSVREKTASANALEMTISSWVDPEYPPAKPFRTQSADSMGAFGKFEVVFGYVVEYVNSPFCQRIVGNYFVSIKSECDRESLDPAFT